MLFAKTLAALVVRDFLFPLTGVVDAREGFSRAGAGSVPFCSFSFCFSSLGGAENQEQDATVKKYASRYMRYDSILPTLYNLTCISEHNAVTK